MTTIDSKTIAARVNNRKARLFEEYCRDRGTTPSMMMNGLIDSALDGNEMEIDDLQYEGVLLVNALREGHTDEEVREMLNECRRLQTGNP